MEGNVTTINASAQQYKELKNAMFSDTTKELYNLLLLKLK